MPKTLLSIDSTTTTAEKTRLPWAAYHGERSGMKLHVSFTSETAVPLQIVETTGLKHDGPIGAGLEDKRFNLVCDRAYFSIDKVDRHVTEKEIIQLNNKISLKGIRHKNRRKNAIASFNLPTTKGETCVS